MGKLKLLLIIIIVFLMTGCFNPANTKSDAYADFDPMPRECMITYVCSDGKVSCIDPAGEQLIPVRWRDR